MVSKHKTYLLPGQNEGRSKSIFRQLRICALWTSKGYRVGLRLTWQVTLKPGFLMMMFELSEEEIRCVFDDK